MYTVLIQTQKGMDEIRTFHPLFARALEEGHLGLCRWDEEGETVETALPDLYEMVSHKRIWRAIVVCPEWDGPDPRFPADAANPFDFLENRGRDGLQVENGVLQDCSAPLIRLTHLLGGMPAPEPRFEPKLVQEQDRVPRIEYRPVEDQQTAVRKQAYADWAEQHRFRGLPPVEIVLVRVRQPLSEDDSLRRVRAAWQTHTEADSSVFWKRNLYPHNCRFLVYDAARQGVLRQQRDAFKLWMSVLLLAENRIDPDVLQAHRLYRMDVSLNEEKLADCFQQSGNELNLARCRIEKSLEQDARLRRELEGEIPDFTVGVPVSFQLPRVSGMSFSGEDYGLTGSAGEDLSVWEQYSSQARDELRTLLQSTERTLDQAASRLRSRVPFETDRVVPLSEYQEEDLNAALYREYREILERQQALPDGTTDIRRRLDEQDKRVRQAILQRMSRRQAVGVLVLSLALMAVCLAPGLLDTFTRLPAAVALGVSLLLLAGAVLLVLRSQKAEFVRTAKEFQRCFQAVLAELAVRAGAYSDFLSSVASHLRGRSYLSVMKQKQARRDSAFYFRQKHLRGIQILLDRLELWCSALHVPADLSAGSAMQQMDEEHEEVDYDRLYAFRQQETMVPLNRIGVQIRSPFGFVERFIIEREEAYEDGGGD